MQMFNIYLKHIYAHIVMNLEKKYIDDAHANIEKIALKGALYIGDFYKLINSYIDNGNLLYFEYALEKYYNINVKNVNSIVDYKYKIWKEILFQTNSKSSEYIKKIFDENDCYQVGYYIYNMDNVLLGTINEYTKYYRLDTITTTVTTSFTSSSPTQSTNLPISTLIPIISEEYNKYVKYEKSSATSSGSYSPVKVGVTYSITVSTEKRYTEVVDYYKMYYYYLNGVVDETLGIKQTYLAVDKNGTSVSTHNLTFSMTPDSSFINMNKPYRYMITYSYNNDDNTTCLTQSVYSNYFDTTTYSTTYTFDNIEKKEGYSYTYDIDTTYSVTVSFIDKTKFTTNFIQSLRLISTTHSIIDSPTSSIFTKYTEALNYLKK